MVRCQQLNKAEYHIVRLLENIILKSNKSNKIILLVRSLANIKTMITKKVITYYCIIRSLAIMILKSKKIILHY